MVDLLFASSGIEAERVAAARPAELEQARGALELVRVRGFHRAKDLLGEPDELIRGT